jgi:hypothetical protein
MNILDDVCHASSSRKGGQEVQSYHPMRNVQIPLRTYNIVKWEKHTAAPDF